jgi:hypothetical protein
LCHNEAGVVARKRANCALMKGLQDNDEDVVQIEDGTGAVGRLPPPYLRVGPCFR